MNWLWRNQLMFNHTQRPAATQQRSAATQLMFNHTQRSAATHLKQAFSPLSCLSTSIGRTPVASVCYNPAKHTRRIIPFNIMDQLPEDGQQAPNILQDVIDLDSDSEEDEVILHWPPGLQFLDDEEFILGNFHNNTAPAAWKKTNYTAKPWCSFPICFFLLTDSVPQSMDRLRWTAFTQVNSIARHHHNKGVIEPSNLFKRYIIIFTFAFNLYVFLAKLLPKWPVVVSLFILITTKTVLIFSLLQVAQKSSQRKNS